MYMTKMDHMLLSFIDRNPYFQIKGLPLLEDDPLDDTRFTIINLQEINSRNSITNYDIHDITILLEDMYWHIHSDTICIEKINFEFGACT